MLIRYGWLIANYHRGFTSNSRLVIWLHGFPGLPKESEDKDFTAFLALWYDVVTPDYYGSHCSDGVFGPQGCIDTLVDTYNFFKEWGIVYYSRNGSEILVSRYDEIIVVWASFGAWFASRVQQYIPECKIIGLRYPFVEASNRAVWEYVGEMTNEEDYKELNVGGQEHLYRGRWSKEWDEFHEDQRWQSYDEMIQDLSTKNVFIVHGDADDCVHVGRSRKLYEQLQAANPSWNHTYLEIPKWWHGWMTKQIGVVEFCKWLNSKS
jgi:esterase/lipase